MRYKRPQRCKDFREQSDSPRICPAACARSPRCLRTWRRTTRSLASTCSARWTCSRSMLGLPRNSNAWTACGKETQADQGTRKVALTIFLTERVITEQTMSSEGSHGSCPIFCSPQVRTEIPKPSLLLQLRCRSVHALHSSNYSTQPGPNRSDSGNTC